MRIKNQKRKKRNYENKGNTGIKEKNKEYPSKWRIKAKRSDGKDLPSSHLFTQ